MNNLALSNIATVDQLSATSQRQLGKKRGKYQKMSTQLVLFHELKTDFDEKIESLSDEQVLFFNDDPRLRDRIGCQFGSDKELAEFSAEVVTEKIKGASFDDDILDLEGWLENTCINMDAFMDRMRKLFPKDSPKTAFQKFCQHINNEMSASYNTVDGEILRVQRRKNAQASRDRQITD